MRKLIIVAVAIGLSAVVSSAFAVDNLKPQLVVGGGMLYNAEADSTKSLGGGHFALQIPTPGNKIAFSPFVDYYKGSGRTTVLSGLDFLVRPRMSSEKANVYFGFGAGISHQKFTATRSQSQTRTVTDSTGVATLVTTTIPVAVSMHPSKALLNLVVGTEIKASEKVSIFIEPRYVWSGASTLSGLTGNVSLAFHLK